MSAHEYIETAIWSDPVILSLRPNARLLYVWSFTNRHCNMVGIYKVARIQVRVETGLTDKQIDASLEECRDHRLLYYDETYMFVRSRVKKLQAKSPNTAKAVARDLRKLNQRHPFVQAFLFLYQDLDWGHLQTQLTDFDVPSVSPLEVAA